MRCAAGSRRASSASCSRGSATSPSSRSPCSPCSANLPNVVKLAIVGSLLGNAVLLGGIAGLLPLMRGGFSATLRFDRRLFSGITTLSMIAFVPMAILSVPSDLLGRGDRQGISLAAGIALTIVGVFFILTELRAPHCPPQYDSTRRRELSFRGGLVVPRRSAALMAALTAEWFVAGFEPAAEAIGIPTAFAALVLIPLLGNVAENYVALRFAWAGDGDGAMSVIMHSVVQIGLLMVGLLVIVSQFIGRTPLSLQLDPVLTVSLGLALIVLWMIMYDGEMQPDRGGRPGRRVRDPGRRDLGRGLARLTPQSPATGTGRSSGSRSPTTTPFSSHTPMRRNFARRGRAALLDRLGLDRVERLRDRIAEQPRGAVVVLVRAAGRLRHDRVDDAEVVAEARRRLERGGGLLALVDVAPQDRGAALGRDHRVDGVLQHQHAIGDADRERAAGAALADHAGHGRHAQPRHREHGLGDGGRLAGLLGLDAGIRAGRVDHRHDREAEAVGEREDATAPWRSPAAAPCRSCGRRAP